MSKLLKSEPVMAFATLVSLAVTVAIVTGKLTLEDVTGFVAVFASVAAVLVPFIVGLVVRKNVTPVDKG